MTLTGRFWGTLAMIASLAAGQSARAADLVPFRVGESSPANTFLAIWMAEDAGFYAANGLKLDIVPMAGGRDMADAFAAGRIDAMHIGLSSVVRANAAGADIRAFGSPSPASKRRRSSRAEPSAFQARDRKATPPSRSRWDNLASHVPTSRSRNWARAASNRCKRAR